MTTRTALFALLAAWGVSLGAPAALAEDDDDTRVESEAAPGHASGLTDRVWVKAESGDNLPGVMRIFLSDGTLVMDSCWETHRLSPWTQVSDTAIRWNEDGIDINAEVVAVSERELVLKLALGNETVEERYQPATVPYLCPDMPK